MADKSKFLVLNPLPVNLDKVLAKANVQNSKNGPFEAILLLGDVLPSLASSIPATDLNAPAYFTEGKNGFHESVIEENEQNGSSDLIDIKANFTMLKLLVKIFKLQSGVVVMMIAGRAELDDHKSEALLLVRENRSKIDILVTYNWPKAIAAEEKLLLVGDSFIDEVVKETKPRYHFAVGNERGKFFEYKPFKWESGEFTRFISLGEEGSGEKWFYAFGLGLQPQNVGTQVGPNPFTTVHVPFVSKKRPAEDETDIKEITQSNIVPKKAKKVTSDQCFFCLSNPNTETHMIISIASHTYMTIAKGPLTRPNKHLRFPGHAIILPIEHIASIREKTSNVIESPIYKEILQYQNSLVKAFLKSNPFYRLVFFEINRLENVHASVQVVPIPEYFLNKFSQTLENKAHSNNERYERNHKLEFKSYKDEKDPGLIQTINEYDYIMFTVYLDENDKMYFVARLTDSSKSVDLQFPRRVLAHLLNLPKRVYWDKCQQPMLQESKDCEEFKKFYHDFDFTL